MKKLLFFLLIWPLLATGKDMVTLVDQIPAEQRNHFYPSNCAPLVPQRLIKLPVGAIEPKGWIATLLQLERRGLCGQLSEISPWLDDNSPWMRGTGENGWEEMPYWLRGYAQMAFLLNDETALKEVQRRVETLLRYQRSDGSFGYFPDSWANMLVLQTMQNYYEYSLDERALQFLKNYFHYQLQQPNDQFLKNYWESSRAGDNLWSVMWLYNRTGDKELLPLMEKIHRHTANWAQPDALPNWHTVNIAQGFREPAEYFALTGDSSLLRAAYRTFRLVRKTCGQVPGGMFGADEHARLGYVDPRQGTETCTFAEQMASDEIMMLLTGDDFWAAHCENVAFNDMPATSMPDLRSIRYLTAPNQVESDRKNHHPGIDNRGPQFVMNPLSYRCCQHNHGFAWPYYAAHLVLATPDNGVATLLYNACKATVKVGQGEEITLIEETNYPFEETIRFSLHMKRATAFPFYLRIPTWAKKPQLRINGKRVKVASGKYVCLHRQWNDGDNIELTLPMKVELHEWQANNGSYSVNYGPLTLSLAIKERTMACDPIETRYSDANYRPDVDTSRWPAWEIFADSPWNYALCTDVPITLTERKPLDKDKNPFKAAESPLRFKAMGRLIPEWGLDTYGLCSVLPEKEAKRDGEVKEIELIPMGAARLRISAFPPALKN